MLIDHDAALAARKHTLDFHARHGVKSINDIALHALEWTALCALEKDARKTGSALLDRHEKATDEQRAGLDTACDALTGLLDAIRSEKDERGFLGTKEPRAQADHDSRIARRPGITPATAHHGGTEADAGDGVVGLKPEERFATWAAARSHGDSEYPGLGLGQYLRSMVVGGKSEIERRALSEGSDSAGGYTVPDVLSATLIDLARAQSVVMRAGAMSVPLTSDTNNWAKLLTDPVPAWRAEAGAVAESDPTFGLVQMVPRSLAVQTKVSAELMEDSLNLATELPRVMAAAMALELDRVALLGSGSAPEPRGISNTVGIGTFAQDAEIASYANLSRARTAILTANQTPTAFVMHPRDEGTFSELVDGDGQPLQMNTRLAEIPWLTTTSIPIDGGSGSDESTIIAGDFTKLLVGIRSEIRVEIIKTSAYASNLQYTLLAHMRADVAVTHPGAFYTLTGVGQAA